MPVLVVIRGGGDLASGTAVRLFRAGLGPLITELPFPLAVRRRVSFAEAIYDGSIEIEGVKASRASDLSQALDIHARNEIPVLIDPHASILPQLESLGKPGNKTVLVDARMLKKQGVLERPPADLVIGLGPGFTAGLDCDAVVETNRGHFLGRVIWHGQPQVDTGIPDTVAGRAADRVIRAPVDGELVALAEIGDLLDESQPVALVGGQIVSAPFQGVLRGLLRAGTQVSAGLKIGDVDPRNDPRYCFLVSEKSLAVGGGVLEAVLSREDLRPHIWG